MYAQILTNLGIKYKTDVPVKSLTGMNQTNILPLVAYPKSINELKHLILSADNFEDIDIFGGLTNTYIAQSFSKKLVIITTHICDYIIVDENTIRVGCGYNLTKLCKELMSKGIAGYIGFIGIPGTVGGATINNSGAFGVEMKDVVKGCHIITSNGHIKFLTNEDLKYMPRQSSLKGKRDYVLLSIDLDISKKGDIQNMERTLMQQKKIRAKKIDGKNKSLGSIFFAPSLKHIYNMHPFAVFFKRLLNIPNKILFDNKKFALWLQFLLLGHPELAKHCDSFNRFCWTKDTSEQDFFYYLNTMQELGNNELRLEIEIRK